MANIFYNFLDSFKNKAPIVDGIKKKNNSINNNIGKLSFQRIKQDTQTWRDAMVEAERAILPFRVQLQRLYIDTILNGQVGACMERRKDLTLLRTFFIKNADGTINEDATALLEENWFNEFISITLDAIFFGYSLISMGDIVNSKFKNIEPVKRWFVSPDRFVVSEFYYTPDGVSFLDPKYFNWNIFIDTPNQTGTSTCGMGLLYQVGLYEIFLRNLLGYNGDFIEMFAQPYRIGKTDKTEIDERDAFEQLLAEMGSSGFALMDSEGDSIEFLESSLGGNGYKGYADLELRLEKKISKLILGHADALDSVPGQLGNSKGDGNPVYLAMLDKKSKDGIFVTNIVNTELLPRMRIFGFNIPIDCYFEFKNDTESTKAMLFFSDIAIKMNSAGIPMDPTYFEEQTGIKVAIPTTEVTSQNTN